MRSRTEISGVGVDAIHRILGSAPVTVGVIFGSVSRGDDHERSDVDLAVAYEEGLSAAERTRERLSLIERLSVRLGTDSIDVTGIRDLPPEPHQSIRNDGVVVYGSLAEAEALLDSAESTRTKEQTIEAFDDILGDIRRVV